jgi:hypothetical protein
MNQQEMNQEIFDLLRYFDYAHGLPVIEKHRRSHILTHYQMRDTSFKPEVTHDTKPQPASNGE